MVTVRAGGLNCHFTGKINTIFNIREIGGEKGYGGFRNSFNSSYLMLISY